MKVRINAGGREVDIDCPDANTTVDAVGATALSIWRATAGATSGGTAGPGFQLHQERRTPSEGFDWRLGEGAPTPVRAQVEHG